MLDRYRRQTTDRMTKRDRQAAKEVLEIVATYMFLLNILCFYVWLSPKPGITFLTKELKFKALFRKADKPYS